MKQERSVGAQEWYSVLKKMVKECVTEKVAPERGQA